MSKIVNHLNYAWIPYISYLAKVDQKSCTLDVQEKLYLSKLEPFLESIQDRGTPCGKIINTLNT